MKYHKKYSEQEIRKIKDQQEVYKTKKEYEKEIENLKQDQAILNTTIYKLEQASKSSSYDYLENLKEYQNFESKSTMNIIEKLILINCLQKYTMES